MGERTGKGKLDLAKRSFTDRDLDSLPLRDVAYPYREVDFSQNNLSTESLHKVVKLCSLCGQLRVLKLYKNGIDDHGARVLANFFRQCGTIEEVHLSHNNFTADGVLAIVEAAERNRHPSAPPLWLRLEQNDVEDAPGVLHKLQQRYSVCARDNRWHCSVRSCANECKVHLPFFCFQRRGGGGGGGRSIRAQDHSMWYDEGQDAWDSRGRGGQDRWRQNSSTWDRSWDEGQQSWNEQEPWSRKRSHGEAEGSDLSDVELWRDREAGRRLRQKLSSGSHAPGGGSAGGLFARAVGAAISAAAAAAGASGRGGDDADGSPGDGGCGGGPRSAPAALAPSPRRSPATVPRCVARAEPAAAVAAREAAASARGTGGGGASAREREREGHPEWAASRQDSRGGKERDSASGGDGGDTEAAVWASRGAREGEARGRAAAAARDSDGIGSADLPRQRRAPSGEGGGAGGRGGNGGGRRTSASGGTPAAPQEAMRRALQGMSRGDRETSGGGGGGSAGASKRPKRRVRITNVPPDLSAQDVAEAFQDNAGKVKSCEILDGVALVDFFKAEDAEKAVSFDNGELNNRIIRVTLTA
mmetsp:Transcript_131874/g.367644  ORF Transcript_131874/g.367644 Transcript_131874/m.367644 type:complete len:586 (-) Transcript_131874:126-1883(-)